MPDSCENNLCNNEGKKKFKFGRRQKQEIPILKCNTILQIGMIYENKTYQTSMIQDYTDPDYTNMQ